MKDMLQTVENWDPICRVAVEAIPKASPIGWKLLLRDPLRKWVSDEGHIFLMLRWWQLERTWNRKDLSSL